MRKFMLFAGVILLLFGFKLWDDGLRELYGEFPDTSVCFYTGEEAVPASFIGSAVKNGDTMILTCPPAEAPKLRNKLKNLKGESVSFAGDDADAQTVIDLYAVKTVRLETLSEGEGTLTVLYGRSPYICGGVDTDGGFVNIQIAVNETAGTVTVGTPLILGSY